MKWVSYGPSSLLFRFAERMGKEALARQRGIVTDLELRPPAGLVEFVPAFTTIVSPALGSSASDGGWDSGFGIWDWS